MKSVEEHSRACKCLHAIGNSLDLHDMLTEVITTIMESFGALGGKYVDHTASIQFGRPFSDPTDFFYSSEEYSINENKEGKILYLPVAKGVLLFSFDRKTVLEPIGNLLSSFNVKLSKAIDACHEYEKLKHLNLHLNEKIGVETNKNKANEKLMISQSRLAIMGEMIGMIAHQWRQPITVIGMLTNNALLDIHLGEIKENQLIHDLKLIDRHVHFLSDTIDDFRNFFRPNKLPVSCTFKEIEHELYTIIGKNFAHHQITLLFEGEHQISFTTYKNELLQVCLNILNNAKDAFSEQIISVPLIRFCLKELPDRLQFHIIDNAGGIQPEILSRIFEPYFSTKNEKHGTGLGLYMSAMIVEKHLKGSLIACSDNQGTLFCITIPKSIDERGYHVY